MKRILTIFFALILTLTLTSCNTSKTLEAEKKELTIKDVIDVKGVKVKINSITRKNEDCLLKYGDECQSKNLPKEGEFLIINVTITNDSDKTFNSSSIASYSLKTKEGDKGIQQLISTYSPTTLDGSILPKEKLTASIVYDIKKSENYNFYFKYDLFSDPVKLTFKNTDIQ